MFITFIAFVVVVGVVIFIHESGHFLAARAVGARVEVFSLGLPPRLVGIKRGDTEYRLGWIPLGGYVKIAGMIDESMDDEGVTGAPDEFMSKSYPSKVFILIAGVLMNFLLGFLIYAFIVFVEGDIKIDPSSSIGSLAEGYPAQEAGMLSGDRIISINSKEISTWEDLTKIIHNRPGESLSISWVHEADTVTSAVVPRTETRQLEDGEREIGLIGITQNITYVKVPPAQAISKGAKLTVTYLQMSVETVSKLVTGRASIKEVTGIVGIVQYSGQTARAGWVSFLGFIGFISISIGFFNILPIPMLDGGHIVMATIEVIIRRNLSTKVKLIIQQVGLALILVLMVVVTYHDVLRIFIK